MYAKLLNTAIEREVHNSHTVDEVSIELNEARVISRLVLRSGYSQIVLHPDSRDITVFSTHLGLFRYIKDFFFCLKSVAEIFQKLIEEVIEGVPNCRNKIDDIVVYSSNQEGHDKSLHMVLQRLEKKGLCLNNEKWAFSKIEFDFFGLHFSPRGIKLKQSKDDVLLLAGPPKDVKQLKRLYGLFSYASNFIKDATKSADYLNKSAKKAEEGTLEMTTPVSKLS